MQELEFDLYDYEHQRMVPDTSTSAEEEEEAATTQRELSELAPRRLFDSTDTIINFADDIPLDAADTEKIQNTFGTPVVLRRGEYTNTNTR